MARFNIGDVVMTNYLEVGTVRKVYRKVSGIRYYGIDYETVNMFPVHGKYLKLYSKQEHDKLMFDKFFKGET